MFVAWEGVGLLSFLLVSFWYSKINTLKSGFKVLFYNRVGDFFFFISLGLALYFLKSDTFANSLFFLQTTGTQSFSGLPALSVLLGFSVVVVILSKSAQFGFHI